MRPRRSRRPGQRRIGAWSARSTPTSRPTLALAATSREPSRRPPPTTSVPPPRRSLHHPRRPSRRVGVRPPCSGPVGHLRSVHAEGLALGSRERDVRSFASDHAPWDSRDVGHGPAAGLLRRDKMHNEVVAFEPNRHIAWAPGIHPSSSARSRRPEPRRLPLGLGPGTDPGGPHLGDPYLRLEPGHRRAGGGHLPPGHPEADVVPRSPGSPRRSARRSRPGQGPVRLARSAATRAARPASPCRSQSSAASASMASASVGALPRRWAAES